MHIVVKKHETVRETELIGRKSLSTISTENEPEAGRFVVDRH
jgi:hypothetical protein